MEFFLWVLAGAGVLFVLVGVWIGIYFWLNPDVKDPDGKACVTGSCGDTMEICLKFRDNRVEKTSTWTNGCAYSFNCLHAAADMAKGRNPDELLHIDADRIQHSVGSLPQDYLHCAKLAEDTLMAALDDYMRKQIPKQG